jgi:O-succinylbenzoic acid--CoA ligase
MSTDSANAFFNAWDEGQTQFTVHSSGSTGHPKTIHLDRQWMEWSAIQTALQLPLQKTDHLLCCLPIDKVGGLMMLCRSKVWGLPITVIPANHNPLLHPIKANIAAFTAYQIYNILEDPNSFEYLKHFKVVLIGGSDIDPVLEKAIQNLPETCSVFHTYGMSETYSHIALRRLNGPSASEVFTLFDGVRISTDEQACALISAPFTQTDIHSSDIVELIDDKHFKVLGRNDFVINSGGLKFHPEAIERLIIEQYAISSPICVSAVNDEALGQKLVLVFAGNNELPSIDWQSIENKIPYSKPKQIIRIEEMPHNSGGKLDRVKVKAIINS